MKPHVWFTGEWWLVSPRLDEFVLYSRIYPRTSRDGYASLAEAADAARDAVS